MTPMIDFSVAMLTALSDFLLSEPVFYLFGLVCFLFIVKAFKILVSKKGGY